MNIPLFPTYSGTIYPIRLTPKGGVDEALVIGILALGDDGQIAGAPFTERKELLPSQLEISSGLQRIATLIISHALDYLRQGDSLDSWHPPLENVGIGRGRKARGSDVWDLVDVGLESSSTLHSVFNELRPAKAVTRSIDAAKLNRKVRQITYHRRPDFLDFFSKEYLIAPRARPLKVDFVGRRTACYFNSYSLGSSIGGFILCAKARLFSLQELRQFVNERGQDLAGPHKLRYELAIAIDENESGACDTEFEEAVEELRYSACAFGMNVSTCNSADALVDRVLQLEQV
jgi:hypothetical protein